MSDELRQAAEHGPSILVAVGGMMRQVRERLSISWSVPVATIAGLILIVLGNTATVIWKGATIVAAIEANAAELKAYKQRNDEAVRETRVAGEVLRQHQMDDVIVGARLAQQVSDLEKRVDYHRGELNDLRATRKR